MKEKKKNEVFDKFNLPGYTKGKSFADASKAIQKRFEGRTDRESMETKLELMDRLRNAQEYIKKMQEPAPQQQPQQMQPQMQPGQEQMQMQMQMQQQSKQMPQGVIDQMGQQQMPMDQNQNFMGGMLSGAGGEQMSGMMGKASGSMGVAGGYAGAAMKGVEVGQQMFGKTGVDTSGMTEAPERVKEGAATLKGAASGAQAGGAIVPGWGHAIGAVVGGAGGLIGAKRSNNDIADAERNVTYNKVNQSDNMYADGGWLGSMGSKGLSDMANSLQMNTNQLQTNPFNPDLGALPTGNMNGGNNISSPADPYGSDSFELDNKTQQNNDFTKTITGNYEKTGFNDASLDQIENAANNSGQNNEYEDNQNKYNPGKLLRYAPLATNAYQLATLSKPEKEKLDRMSGEYNEQYVDESSLQNNVRQGSANVRDSILGSSGGSQSAARANLLGSSVQTTKAMSDAYINAENINRSENKTGQQVQTQADQQNLNQSNQESIMNAQNRAAYDNERSKLLSSISNDLGEIGKEEKYKDYPKMMGMFYDSNGKLITTPEQMKKFIEESKSKR